MRNIKLTIQYDGSDYHGWQRQAAGLDTIQLRVEQAAGRVMGHPVTVFGAGRTDGFTIASAVCGITGIVPFVTQVIGLACGVVGLVRIRRARRRGRPVRGVGWAITGITSSGFVLLCWLAVFVGLSLVSSTFANTAESLSTILDTSP